MSPTIYTPHDCEKPGGNLPDGSLYQCPECDRVWELETVRTRDSSIRANVWTVLEDPRRAAILRDACAQNNPPATPTVAPAMVQLVLDTYTDHMTTLPSDDNDALGTCGECETGIYGPHTIQAHAREKAVEALQDALGAHRATE